MASIRKCDICGKCEEGRKPNGFHEVSRYRNSIYMPDGYSDLCEDCYEEYEAENDKALKIYRETINNWFKSKGEKE